MSSKRYPSRFESRAGCFASTREEFLSPRVRLECNPEIPVAPGEEHWLLAGSYTSPLRKSGENNFHKLERKKPGFQRVLGTQWSFDTTSTFRQQTGKLRPRADWKPSLDPWISTPRCHHKASSPSLLICSGEKLPCLSFTDGWLWYKFTGG